MRSTKSNRRKGMTLLEIIVSMAIFLMALGAIVPLIQMGQQRALEVQLQAIALEKCQSKLGELEVGSEALGGGGEMGFPDDTEGWLWAMESTPNYNGVANLWFVQVHVYRMIDDGRKIDVSLGALIMDPSIRGAPLLQPTTTTTMGGS
jgi:general secretion pathway protein I